MQASQSNSAYELLGLETKSDRKQDSTFTRSLPSPFAAPIQAARKYLERQRGDAWQTGGEEVEPARPGTLSPKDEPAVRDQTSRDQTSRDQASREQDRRLERSLYERNSIEAGLNFEALQGSHADARPGEERTYLAEIDGSESSLFPYAAPGPPPDPDAVRGAILRLARESEFRRKSVTGPAIDSSRDIAGNKAVETGSLAVEAPRPLNFSDVARRVWGAELASSGDASHTESEFESVAPAKGLEIPMESGTSRPTEAASPKGAAASEMKLAAVLPNAASAAGCVSEQEPALAHDACNLLSALALYSDLLASPGVLGEPYLHYAGELRLIATRSQVLIDRLLRTAATRREQAGLSHDETGAAAASEGGSGGLLPSREDYGEGIAMPTPGTGDLSTNGAPVPRLVAKNATDVLRQKETSVAETLNLHPHTYETSVPERVSSPVSLATGDRLTEGTSLVDLLMRWGSLLSTLAHGTLEVVFGPHAATPVPAEAEALERILVNLVRNARAATIAGGAIRISVREIECETSEGDAESATGIAPGPDAAHSQEHSRGIGTRRAIALTVDDSGCGMTEAQVRRLLGEDSDLDGDGLPIDDAAQGDRRQGLGLRIVRELVAASGGTLSIQSRPGRGTRVEIRWPLMAVTEAAAIQEKTDPVAAVPETSDAAIQATPRIAETRAQALPIETTQTATRPDGFSEVELRAMMLRLHRAGPQERSPLSRRLSDRRGEPQEADRGFGIVGSGAEAASRNRPTQTDAAAKGAIAC